ncbi:unnamed protein product [Linum trigynum]|uniref:Uncharacterized protein n=1 Tax=Linum trigynum TaxID=586398 RepID=A0AAV2FCG7_9ROSI
MDLSGKNWKSEKPVGAEVAGDEEMGMQAESYGGGVRHERSLRHMPMGGFLLNWKAYNMGMVEESIYSRRKKRKNDAVLWWWWNVGPGRGLGQNLHLHISTRSFPPRVLTFDSVPSTQHKYARFWDD